MKKIVGSLISMLLFTKSIFAVEIHFPLNQYGAQAVKNNLKSSSSYWVETNGYHEFELNKNRLSFTYKKETNTITLELSDDWIKSNGKLYADGAYLFNASILAVIYTVGKYEYEPKYNYSFKVMIKNNIPEVTLTKLTYTPPKGEGNMRILFEK